MIEEWKEFTGEDRQRAVAAALSHFSVSEDQLEVRALPPAMSVSGLGARVLILASIRETPSPVEELSDVGEFISAVVQKLGVGDRLRVRESDEDGAITVRLSAPGLDELIRRDPAVVASLSHLAERAAQKFLGDAMEARVEIVREQRESRDSRGGGRRDSRGGGRNERGDRGDGRGRPREGGREGRDGRGPRRGGRGDRPERGADRGGDRTDRGGDRGGRSDGDTPRDPELEQKARETAERVRDSGQEVTLPAMGSRDRWIVHNAIRDIQGVTSTSVGEGDQKRVKILPE